VRSQNRPVINSLLFHALKINSVSMKMAFSIETPSQKPYCSETRILLLTKCCSNLLCHVSSICSGIQSQTCLLLVPQCILQASKLLCFYRNIVILQVFNHDYECVDERAESYYVVVSITVYFKDFLPIREASAVYSCVCYWHWGLFLWVDSSCFKEHATSYFRFEHSVPSFRMERLGWQCGWMQGRWPVML
jgi:hypothetical protein